MRNEDTITVFTKDNIELDKCHNSRARQLIKKEEAKIITLNNIKCLQLNKTYDEIIKYKEVS